MNNAIYEKPTENFRKYNRCKTSKQRKRLFKMYVKKNKIIIYYILYINILINILILIKLIY